MAGDWPDFINVLWSTWDHAQAVAFLRIPESQPEKPKKKSDTAKKLYDLAHAASIRSKGIWATGEIASPSERSWAETAYPFPITKPLNGAKGLLALCDGVL